MTELKVNQITYEAFGKVHRTFTDLVELNDILGCLLLITPTAKLRQVERVLVPRHDYQKNNLDNVKKWYSMVGSTITEDEVQEYLRINKSITNSILDRYIPDETNNTDYGTT